MEKQKNLFVRLGGWRRLGRCLCGLLAVMLLVTVGTLFFRRKPALAAEYNLKRDGTTGKYVFHVVEIVPDRNDAILGLFIGGAEEETLSMDRLTQLVRSCRGNYDALWQAKNYIYWAGKRDSTGNEPFSIVEENGQARVVNNEIFKLYMLGDRTLDTNKSIYENLLSNQSYLADFEKQYTIDYQVGRPELLDSINLEDIQYLHVGSACQMTSYPQFYGAAGNSSSGANWDKAYGNDGDCSWKTALSLYNRAMEKKTAVSFAAYQAVGNAGSHSNNVYRLYQMLYYFDDPSLFKETLKGGALTTEKSYIDPDTGRICTPWAAAGLEDWDENYFRELNLKDVVHTKMGHYRKDAYYHPSGYENILMYGSNSQKGEYFDSITTISEIQLILNAVPKQEDPITDQIHVLEIEPCGSYWLSNPDALGRLAAAAGVSPSQLSITKVTPNALNAMTVDLTAEYDLLLVGNQIDYLRPDGNYEKQPYRHIGFYSEAVILEDGELARFSGNDVTREMQGQLARFVKSGQPVIVASQVLDAAKTQLAEFQSWDAVDAYAGTAQPENDNETRYQDARLYYGLAGIEDETAYYGKQGADGIGSASRLQASNLYTKENSLSGNGSGTVALRVKDKPVVEISNDGGLAGAGQDIAALERQDSLTFSYNITLPAGMDFEAGVMVISIDRNGDGIFDEKEDLEEEASANENAALPDEANAAVPDRIREDFVETVPFSSLSPDSYRLSGNSLTGIYVCAQPVDSIETACQIQVRVQTQEKTADTEPLAGVGRAYMRPSIKGKAVRILQIMPDEPGSGALSANQEFRSQMAAAQAVGSEYQFNFDNGGFEAIRQSDFLAGCTQGTITAETLKQYDLLIVGADFGDADNAAATVLGSYADLWKRPIIFTRDTVAQPLRNIAGMNRFAPEEGENSQKTGCDTGTGRRWVLIDELAGLTNGALLERAGTQPVPGIIGHIFSPYNTERYSGLNLGAKPRPEYVKAVNEGALSLYPFHIAKAAEEEAGVEAAKTAAGRIRVAENHLPLYQLDLERQRGQGILDDVTVWYAFDGSGRELSSASGCYLDAASGDGGNNYYLYSKGNLYYTGFAIPKAEDTEETVQPAKTEMKLFINTIYAALKGDTTTQGSLDTVVREEGTLSLIWPAAQAGVQNQYVYYYDSDSSTLTLSFRIQRQNGAEDEKIPVFIGKKTGETAAGFPVGVQYPAQGYELSGLPEGCTVKAFPVTPITAVGAGGAASQGSHGSAASDIWYQLTLPSVQALDGQTLLIGPAQTAADGSESLMQDAVYAQISFVMRTLFELD